MVEHGRDVGGPVMAWQVASVAYLRQNSLRPTISSRLTDFTIVELAQKTIVTLSNDRIR